MSYTSDLLFTHQIIYDYIIMLNKRMLNKVQFLIRISFPEKFYNGEIAISDEWSNKASTPYPFVEEMLFKKHHA